MVDPGRQHVIIYYRRFIRDGVEHNHAFEYRDREYDPGCESCNSPDFISRAFPPRTPARATNHSSS